MAKEASKLIKEFKPSDLRRIKNLTKKDYTSYTTTQSGYQKVEIERSEGEVFEENGNKYVIENGIKRKHTALSGLRNLVKVPLFCPCCNKPLHHNIDKRMYMLKKMCLDCNIQIESEMKLAGTFKSYQDSVMSGNYKAELLDFKDYLINYNANKTAIVNSEGDVEEWSGNSMDISSIIASLDEELEKL